MCDVRNGLDYTLAAEREAGVGNGSGFTNGNAAKYWEWLRLVIGTLLIPWAMWISYTLVGIDKRVAIIESNRFDSDDGQAIWRELNQKADKDQVPPQWFLDDVRQLQARLDRHEETKH